MIKSAAIIDLGYGDSGKGTTVEWMCNDTNASFVIRFNGGSQAAHNVHLKCGHSHTFSQFGSGTFQGIPTYLTKYVGIDPLAMWYEALSLSEFMGDDVLRKLYIHKDSMVITPFHRALNRFKELKRGDAKHGSCGVGYGVMVEISLSHPELTLYYVDLLNKSKVTRKLEAIQRYMVKEYPQLGMSDDFQVDIPDIVNMYHNIYMKTITVDDVNELEILTSSNNVWEGAQGLLLDENYGFHPNTTWSSIGKRNIISLYEHHGLYLGDTVEVEFVGVLRTYLTRHGAGVLVTEDDECSMYSSDDDNTVNLWQDSFRSGHLDLVMLKYAMNVCSVDSFALTHFDKFETFGTVKVCSSYETLDGTKCLDIFPRGNLSEQEELTEFLYNVTPEYDDIPTGKLIDVISTTLGVDCVMVSSGKTIESKLKMKRI